MIKAVLFDLPAAQSVRYVPDGLLVIEAGQVKAFGSYGALQHQYADVPMTHYLDRLIVPGFVDTHIHFPQTEMIAAFGTQLLDWLERYTFPTEAKFKDPDYAQRITAFFLDELLKNGTTTALVYGTVHPESVEAFFAEAERRQLRMIAGKVMMDRHAPDYLCDTPESSYAESKRLIERWHGRGRLHYAVTPRFAVTSSAEQLRLAGQLLAEFPDVYLQTHISENLHEVAWVGSLFPEAQDYLDVYDRAGLVGDRSVFAHGIHLSDREWARLHAAKSAIAFCPTSNLFLGSGLFQLKQACDRAIKVGLGTDVGGGTSFSLLQTAAEGYKVCQLQQHTLSAFQALFLATLGGARALSLDAQIGSFDVGKEADFTVLHPRATPLLALRNPQGTPESLEALADRLFSTIMLGCDRVVWATHILGESVYQQVSI
ncbi:MAG: guanine deaminase [Leptolyngbya sp. SIO4C1]|nr:guanine deaminase [Leptolyngbya sp. SIO4C1]